MKTPNHFSNRGFWAELLIPFSLFYYLIIRLKFALSAAPKSVSVPVICVGNITAGGSGKTPVAIAIANHFKASGKQVAFLSRGYGGKIKITTKVDPAKHSPRDVGDEPLLLAKIAPTYIGANRHKSAQAAIADGAKILIMDDGLQHSSLQQTIRLLVVDGPFGFGNQLLLPAGPLRDKISNFTNIDGLIIIGQDHHNIAKKFPNTPNFVATLEPQNTKHKTQNTPFLAFAGIGRPEKFFTSLRESGYNLPAVVTLPDHHTYRPKDLDRLESLAQKHGAKLITTEKDAIKLPSDFLKNVEVFPIKAALDKKLFELIASNI